VKELKASAVGKTSGHESRLSWLPWITPLFVWGTWALLLAAGLAFVARYGSNIPSWDDWDMIPTMTGEQPITATWLWSQHNEHRIPVPRLLMLALYRVFGCDFRVGMYFNVLSTAALALALILAARQGRGRLSWSDAFFPVLLLNWSEGVNFIWGWQVEFFLSTLLAGIMLLLIVRSGSQPTIATAAAAGICLALLVGSGAHGLALVPALALWLAFAAVLRWRSGEPRGRRECAVILGIAASVFLLVALYFLGYERVPYHPLSANPWAALATAVQFMTMGFGPAVRPLWPLSGLGVLAVLLGSAALLAVVAWTRPPERYRAAGLFLFLAAMGCLALALGLGRNGFEPRYITLSVPALCCVYFACDLYAPPQYSRFLRLALLAAPCLALWFNTQFGLAYAQDLRSRLAAFEHDMASGVPSYQLINRYGPYLHIHQEIAHDYMPLLRRAGVGAFRSLQDDPPLREVPLRLEPTTLRQVQWRSNTAYATGATPSIDFQLPQAQYVCGIRLKYTHSNDAGTAPCVTLYWKSRTQEDFNGAQSWKNSPTGDRLLWEHGTWMRRNDPESTMEVWVCATVDEIRLCPDLRPCIFKISELVLLVPPVGEW